MRRQSLNHLKRMTNQITMPGNQSEYLPQVMSLTQKAGTQNNKEQPKGSQGRKRAKALGT
jgi:hypothetical protein